MSATRQAELLGDERGDDRVGTLADIGGAAEHRDAGTVDLDVDLAVGQAVAVDGEAGAAEVRGDREPLAVAVAALALVEARGLERLLGHLVDPAGGDPQAVDRARVGFDVVESLQLDGVHPEVLGDLVEVQLEREARLGRPVPPLGPAGRLVGEDAAGLEAVGGQVIGHRLQRAGVVHRRDTEGAVGPSVEGGAEVHGQDPALSGDAGAHPHEHRVAPPVRVEHLLARQGALDGPPGDHRQLRDDQLVGEGVRLAAEAPAVGGRDHPDALHGKVEDLGQRALDVVGRLGGGAQGELAVGEGRGGRVLLQGQMGAALVEEDVLAHEVRRREALLDVAELERGHPMDVAGLGLVVDRLVGGFLEGLLDRGDRGKRLVSDADQPAGGASRLLVEGCDGRDRVTDVAHLLELERPLVLADGQDPEAGRQRLAGEDRNDAGQLERVAGVDAEDAGVRVRAAYQRARERPRQGQVVGVDDRTGHLGERVEARQRRADDAELAALFASRARPEALADPIGARPGHSRHVSILPASATASTMLA